MKLSLFCLVPLFVLALSSCADGGADDVVDAALRVDAAPVADATTVDAASADASVADVGVGPVDLGNVGIDASADLGVDAAVDLGIDASADLGVDARIDAAVDLGIDAGPTCAYSCVLSTDSREATCLTRGSPVSLYGAGSDADANTLVSVVDMSRYRSMTVTADICNPTGWLIDLCDSSTCNGYGGDSSTMSHCAELQLFGTTISAYGSAYASPTPGGLLYSKDGVVESRGCTAFEFTVLDSNIRVPSPSLDWRSEYLHRINPPRDEHATPDALWFLSLNRVNYPESTDRVGSGVERVTLCFN